MIVLGTSGWQYDDWRGRFYPADLAKSRWLEHYAARFGTVEVNNAFYRLPERTTFTAWRERTPADFRIGVKVSRYLTHVRRLREPAEPVARFLERAAGLGDKLGPALLQLPPTLAADLELLDAVLARFPAGVQVAVEPRHASWWGAPTRAVLERRGAALCWAAVPPCAAGWTASSRRTARARRCTCTSTTIRAAPPLPTQWRSRRSPVGRALR